MPTVTFSGLASGIDGDAVIKAMNDSKRLAAIPWENNREHNDRENTALEEFNSKLLSFRDALQDFTTLEGGAFSKRATVSNSDALGASVKSNAVSSSTTIEVHNLARTASVSFLDKFEDIDSPLMPDLSEPGTIDISIGSGDSEKTYEVEVSSETTLSDLVQSINEQTEEQVYASLVNTGSESNPQYVLLLQGQKMGVEEGSLNISVSEKITSQGFLASTIVEQAEDSVLTVSGVGQITRSSNSISDIFPGVTLELKQENTGPVNLNVANDPEKTAQKFAEVVAALNELIKFSDENDTVERVEDEKSVKNVYGPLARTKVDDQAIEGIRRAIMNASSTKEDTGVRIFPDLGITIERDGTYKFDMEKFQESMAEDPAAAQEIITGFADGLANANGFIAQYTRFQGHIDSAIEANEEENSSIADRLERLEDAIERQSERLRMVYANLESTISRLNSNGDAMMSMLAGLQNS